MPASPRWSLLWRSGGGGGARRTVTGAAAGCGELGQSALWRTATDR
jgi:hypothetical protein